MTADELRFELETELKWRQEELAFFKNQLSNIPDEIDRKRYRCCLEYPRRSIRMECNEEAL